jgi:hypothetical protein
VIIGFAIVAFCLFTRGFQVSDEIESFLGHLIAFAIENRAASLQCFY